MAIDNKTMVRKEWAGGSVVTDSDLNRLENQMSIGSFRWHYGNKESVPIGWVLCDGREIDNVGRLSGVGEALYKALGDHIQATTGRRILPDMMQSTVPMFVGCNNNDGEFEIGEQYPTVNTMLMSHNHTIDFGHYHDNTHTHSIYHRHRTYSMYRNYGPKDLMFPNGNASEVYGKWGAFNYTARNYGRRMSLSDVCENMDAGKNLMTSQEILTDADNDAIRTDDMIRTNIDTNIMMQIDKPEIDKMHPNYLAMLPIIKY